MGALRVVSFAGILINVCYLGLTTDFFNQVGHYARLPPDVAAHRRVVAAEHLLLLLKVLVDKAFPDVPDHIHIDRTRDEFLVDHFHKKKASARKEQEQELEEEEPVLLLLLLEPPNPSLEPSSWRPCLPPSPPLQQLYRRWCVRRRRRSD